MRASKSLLTLALLASTGCAGVPKAPLSKPTAMELLGGLRVGLAYSGYRAGQNPKLDAVHDIPSREQILEDLRLIEGVGVRLIRQYGAGPLERRVLEVIAAEGLRIRVLQGAWLSAELSAHETCAWLDAPIPEARLLAHRRENAAEIERVIALAREYPSVIVAVNVGNETLVRWNDHLVSVEAMVGYLDRVRAAIPQPVSTADNYLAWVEHADALRDHVDFTLVHTYPVWEGKTLDEAIGYTEANLDLVREALSDLPLMIGEAGWPSEAVEFGDRASEAKQARHLRELLAYAKATGTPVFLFEAFDEDWKGGPDPSGAEKHWGVFDIERQPKAILRSRPLLTSE